MGITWNTGLHLEERVSGRPLPDQMQLPGSGHGVGAVDRAELVEDVTDVAFHGIEGHDELVGDVAVWPPGREETQHLEFPRG